MIVVIVTVIVIVIEIVIIVNQLVPAGIPSPAFRQAPETTQWQRCSCS